MTSKPSALNQQPGMTMSNQDQSGNKNTFDMSVDTTTSKRRETGQTSAPMTTGKALPFESMSEMFERALASVVASMRPCIPQSDGSRVIVVSQRTISHVVNALTVMRLAIPVTSGGQENAG